MIFLRSVEIREWSSSRRGEFPFSLGILHSLKQIAFTAPVTFFVGEDGSGKSTLLEALACAVDSIAVGTESLRNDRTLTPLRELSRHFRLVWQRRTHRGFFLPGQDFFGHARTRRQRRYELRPAMDGIEQGYKDRSSYPAELPRVPYVRELGEIERRHGDGLDARSHYGSFLELIQDRFVPEGLYLLDEPEAELSPTQQLIFTSLLKGLIERDSQFIIATHSPIILAYPGAAFLSFDGGQIRPLQYQQLAHVNLTRDFLDGPESFLRHL
jgi:predicted ATPase